MTPETVGGKPGDAPTGAEATPYYVVGPDRRMVPVLCARAPDLAFFYFWKQPANGPAVPVSFFGLGRSAFRPSAVR